LKQDYEVVGWFDNPNIWPEEEHARRLLDVQRLSALWHVLVDVAPYDHARYLAATRGFEAEPEGGRRCLACYRLRLAAAADAAARNGCSVVASTLTIGRTKRARDINAIGSEVCSERGLHFLAVDWKKRGGEDRSVAISKEMGMYRQDYCGCEFSARARRAPDAAQ
jgi:predicted adenine nucleotide alpha hydrolase (AANH) superfamily ATPase